VDRTKSLFDDAPAGADPAMRWLESGGDPVEAFCRQALYADLLVLGQHDPSAALPGSVSPGFVESVLICTPVSGPTPVCSSFNRRGVALDQRLDRA